MTVLDEILATKRDEVTVLHQPKTRSSITAAALAALPALSFAARIREKRVDGRLGVIAEFKRRSPSRGDLAPDLDVATTVEKYVTGGAAALSVLTDGPFFGGTAADLQSARVAAPATPIIRKDFIIDPVQVYESVGLGADAVLLIVAAIPDNELLADLLALTEELGRDALVEVHNEIELERALQLEAAIIGVNARDLGTFSEDLKGSEILVRRIPGAVLAIAESAIKTVDDAIRMGESGFDAILVGETFARASDPSATVASFANVMVKPRS